MHRLTLVLVCFALVGCDQEPAKWRVTAAEPSKSTQSSEAAPAATLPIAPAEPPAEIGRFTIIHSPETERDTVLLDTVTGKTWVLTTQNYLTDEPFGWDPVARMDNSDEAVALMTAHPPKPASPQRQETQIGAQGAQP